MANQVRRLLGEFIALFEAHRVVYWPARMRGWANRLDIGDSANVVREIRNEWGGMGGISDVAILRANGNVVDDEAAAARRLDDLRDKLWDAVKTG